jgi:hypothetical protein
MAQNTAIETLVKEREKLIVEKTSAVRRFMKQIVDIETAIERLSGKKAWEVEAEMGYDDTNPDYIKGSLEEI